MRPNKKKIYENLSHNKLIQNMREPKQYLKAVFTKKLISYLRKGKITLTHSFKYQDIGRVIETVELSDTDWMVTRRDIEKLIEGTYPFNFESESFQTPAIEGRANDTNYPLFDKIPFQQVQKQVSDLVVDHNPEWFRSHKEIFEKMTDGMFEMEYDELTFLIRLYEAIGFLGPLYWEYSQNETFFQFHTGAYKTMS